LRNIVQKRLQYIGNIYLNINAMYFEQKNKKLGVAIPDIVKSGRREQSQEKSEEENGPEEDAQDD
jgi:hypothetical protein